MSAVSETKLAAAPLNQQCLKKAVILLRFEVFDRFHRIPVLFGAIGANGQDWILASHSCGPEDDAPHYTCVLPRLRLSVDVKSNSLNLRGDSATVFRSSAGFVPRRGVVSHTFSSGSSH